jgi:hypothetical protein
MSHLTSDRTAARHRPAHHISRLGVRMLIAACALLAA